MANGSCCPGAVRRGQAGGSGAARERLARGWHRHRAILSKLLVFILELRDGTVQG